MSREFYCEDKKKLSYDYEKQVWIKDGVYQNCGHPEKMDCGCYGREHKNEVAIITENCQ